MEELVIIAEVSELVVEAPTAVEFVVYERPSMELLEVIERGPAVVDGPAGPAGPVGPAGPAGTDGLSSDDVETLAWLGV
jgi:hypothetical protein